MGFLNPWLLIALAGVPDLRDEQAAAMAEFVRQGGGLVITLGDKVDAKLYNARLGSSAAPLLPGELLERKRAAALKGAADGAPAAAASTATAPATAQESRRLREELPVPVR